ncbi:Mediator of RNA polymerase II transcription subunit 11 [Spatholobus suberectus]|nr:Mediator of RNA polymerase II transcription subunit 11 [Spatholobus suberectus]
MGDRNNKDRVISEREDSVGLGGGSNGEGKAKEEGEGVVIKQTGRWQGHLQLASPIAALPSAAAILDIQVVLRDEIKSACEYRLFEKCDHASRIANEICYKKVEFMTQLDAMKQTIDEYHAAEATNEHYKKTLNIFREKNIQQTHIHMKIPHTKGQTHELEMYLSFTCYAKMVAGSQ